MSETVFMFGAGINYDLRNDEGLRPPLATNFFQQIFKQDQFKIHRYFVEERYLLFGYIERYWKLSPEPLKDAHFDLEECYTLIQLQLNDALENGNEELSKELSQIQLQLTLLFGEYLATFRPDHFSEKAKSFNYLGEIIYKEQGTVITFNYDNLLENAIKNASGGTQYMPKTLIDVQFRRIHMTDEVVAHSHSNWNLPLAYGIEFDEVRLQIAGGPLDVSGERFYSHPHNKMYEKLFLKLHGSVNWFTYSGIKSGVGRSGWTEEIGVEMEIPHEIENAKDRTGKIILSNESWSMDELPKHKNEILNPVIITLRWFN